MVWVKVSAYLIWLSQALHRRVLAIVCQSLLGRVSQHEPMVVLHLPLGESLRTAGGAAHLVDHLGQDKALAGLLVGLEAAQPTREEEVIVVTW